MPSLKGSLGAVDLANVFQVLSLNQREGTLWIFDGVSRKAIWFGRDGASMLTRGRHQPDAVGRILVRNDRLTREQLAQALRLQAEQGGAPLGQVIAENGLASREDVEDALRTQIEEEIHSLFIWKDAQFEFVEGPPDPELSGDDVARLTFNVNRLIMEATKRGDEWEWIQRILPSGDEILRYSGTNVSLEDEVFAQPYAGKVLAAVDGHRSVDEIVAETCVHRFEVAKMLALLLEGKAVEPLPVPELRRHAQAALARQDTEQAVKFLRRLVALKGDTPDMHRQVAEVFESRGELALAASHYRAYAEIVGASGDRNRAYATYRHIHRLVPTDLDAGDRAVALYSAGCEGIDDERAGVCGLGKALAEVHLELGRRARAIEVLQRVAALDPEDADVRHRLIHAYLLHGMRSEAVAEYDALGEGAIAARDWDGAEKIFRKILQVDRTREDAQARLNQILARRRLRRRGIRIAVASALVASALAFAGYRGWHWLEESRHIRVAEASEFGSRLSDLRIRHQPLRDDLDLAAKALIGATGDPSAMVRALRDDAESRPALVSRANEAVREFHALAQAFPAVADAAQATDAAQAVEHRVAFLDSQAEGLRQQVTRTVDDLFDRVEPWPPPLTLAQLDKILQRITELAEVVPEWKTGERGVRALSYARNVSETLGAFESMREQVRTRLAADDLPGAQDRLVEFLAHALPPKDVLELVEVPRRIVSRPAGARILVDGADTGLRTPAVVSSPLLSPVELRLEREGFSPAEVRIRGLERIDPRTLRQELELDVQASLHKELAFRTPILGARLSGTPAAAGDRFVVPTKGDEAAVFDVTGAPRASLPTPSLSGVQVRPVVAADLVVLASYDGTLFPVSLNGERYARESLGANVVADPAQRGDLAFFADASGRVTAYDTLRLRIAWRWPAQAPGRADGYVAAPSLHDGELYLVAADGSVTVLDPSGGRKLRASAGPVAAEGDVLATSLAGSGSWVVGAAQPRRGRTRIVLLDRGTLAVKSSFEVEGDAVGPPLVADGVAHLVTRQGEVWSLTIQDGALASARSLRLDVGTAAAGEPLLADGTLWVGDAQGVLWAVRVGRGTPELDYDFRIPGTERHPVGIVTRPALVGDHVVFGAADNSVYGIRR